jgi:hypothetical protein
MRAERTTTDGVEKFKDMDTLFDDDDVEKRLTETANLTRVDVVKYPSVWDPSDSRIALAAVDMSRIIEILLDASATCTRSALFSMVHSGIRAMASMSRECTCGAWARSDVAKGCTCFFDLNVSKYVQEMLRRVDTGNQADSMLLFTPLMSPAEEAACRKTTNLTARILFDDGTLTSSAGTLLMRVSAMTQFKNLGGVLARWGGHRDAFVFRPTQEYHAHSEETLLKIQRSELRDVTTKSLWTAPCSAGSWDPAIITAFAAPMAVTPQVAELNHMQEYYRECTAVLVDVTLTDQKKVTITNRLEKIATNIVQIDHPGDKSKGLSPFSVVVNVAQPAAFPTSPNVLSASVSVTTTSVDASGKDIGKCTSRGTNVHVATPQTTNAAQFMEWQLSHFGGNTAFSLPINMVEYETRAVACGGVFPPGVRAALPFLMPHATRMMVDVPTEANRLHDFLTMCGDSMRAQAKQSVVGSYVLHPEYGSSMDTVVMPACALTLAIRLGGSHWVDPYALEDHAVVSMLDILHTHKTAAVSDQLLALEALVRGEMDGILKCDAKTTGAIVSVHRHVGASFYHACIRFSTELNAELYRSTVLRLEERTRVQTEECATAARCSRHRLCHLRRGVAKLVVLCGLRSNVDAIKTVCQMDQIGVGESLRFDDVREVPLVALLLELSGLDPDRVMGLLRRDAPCAMREDVDDEISEEDAELVDAVLAIDDTAGTRALCAWVAHQIVIAADRHGHDVPFLNGYPDDADHERTTALRKSVVVDMDRGIVDRVMTPIIVEECMAMLLAWTGLMKMSPEMFRRQVRVGYVTTCGGIPAFTTLTGPLRSMHINDAAKTILDPIKCATKDRVTASLLVRYLCGVTRTFALSAMSEPCGQGHVMFGYDLEPASVLGNPQTHSLLRMSHAMTALSFNSPHVWCAMVKAALAHMVSMSGTKEEKPLVVATSTALTGLLMQGPARARAAVGIILRSCPLRSLCGYMHVRRCAHAEPSAYQKRTLSSAAKRCEDAVRLLVPSDGKADMPTGLSHIMFGRHGMMDSRKHGRTYIQKYAPQFPTRDRVREDEAAALKMCLDSRMASEVGHRHSTPDAATMTSTLESRIPTSTPWELMGNLFGNPHAIHVCGRTARVFLPALAPGMYCKKDVSDDIVEFACAAFGGKANQRAFRSATGTLRGKMTCDTMVRLADHMIVSEQCCSTKSKRGSAACKEHDHEEGRRGSMRTELHHLARPAEAPEATRACLLCYDPKYAHIRASIVKDMTRGFGMRHTAACPCRTCTISVPHAEVMVRSLLAWEVSMRALGRDAAPLQAPVRALDPEALEAHPITVRRWTDLKKHAEVAKVLNAMANACISSSMEVDDTVKQIEVMEAKETAKAKARAKVAAKNKQCALRALVTKVRGAVVDPYIEESERLMREASTIRQLQKAVDEFTAVEETVKKRLPKKQQRQTLNPALLKMVALRTMVQVLKKCYRALSTFQFEQAMSILDAEVCKSALVESNPLVRSARARCAQEFDAEADAAAVQQEIDESVPPVSKAQLARWMRQLDRAHENTSRRRLKAQIECTKESIEADQCAHQNATIAKAQEEMRSVMPGPTRVYDTIGAAEGASHASALSGDDHEQRPELLGPIEPPKHCRGSSDDALYRLFPGLRDAQLDLHAVVSGGLC